MNDEVNSAQFLDLQGLYYAPKVLEELYKALGCKNFSERFFEDYRGTIAEKEEKRNHPICATIRTKVLDRLSLFLSRHKDNQRQEIHHQMKDQLVVNVYDRIEVIKELGIPHKQLKHTVKAGRLISHGKDAEKYELWISETEEDKQDYFQ
jgi:Protein of unknown function (DUF3684)